MVAIQNDGVCSSTVKYDLRLWYSPIYTHFHCKAQREPMGAGWNRRRKEWSYYWIYFSRCLVEAMIVIENDEQQDHMKITEIYNYVTVPRLGKCRQISLCLIVLKVLSAIQR